MIITAVTAMTVRADRQYLLAGQAVETPSLPGSEYVYFKPYRELYGRKTEALLVRVETDAGIHGWGEAQAPVGPEVAQAIVEKVLAPIVLGRDPREWNILFNDMYASLRVRGQTTGFQLDAIAAIDTALWDITGKAQGASISDLLGGRFRDRLPCYVSGLLGKSADDRADEALGWVKQGIAGLKPLLGFGARADRDEMTAIRAAVGAETRLFADVLWRYDGPTATRLGRHLEELQVEFLESPLEPEDISGHAALARDLDIAIAVGEPLRTRYQFLPWFRQQALDICQPDLMRNGISETAKIAAMAEAYNIPVALHNGAVTVVGMAATWQTAATLPNFYIQELEPQMMELFNPWLPEPLRLENGEAVVPSGPGLGIELDEERVAADVDSQVRVHLNS
jgi:D-galactarolactone cycloisomerase